MRRFSCGYKLAGSHLFGLPSVSASEQNTTIREISRVGSLRPRRSIPTKLTSPSRVCVRGNFYSAWLTQDYNANKILPDIKDTKQRIRSISRLMNTDHFKAQGSYSHSIRCMGRCRC